VLPTGADALACGFADEGSIDSFGKCVMLEVPGLVGIAFDNQDTVHFTAEADRTHW